MRLTDKSIANNSLNNMQINQERLVKLQQQASSGLKINAPGDDPVGAQQALQLKGALRNNEQYARNIVTGNVWLGQTDNAMSSMGDIVGRAHEIAMEMANGAINADNRNAAVTEVRQLTEQLAQFGNTQVGGRYIFGGFKNDSAPFSAGTFSGTDDAVNIKLDGNSNIAINYSGGKLLKGTGGGVDVFTEMQNLSTALSTNNQSGIRSALATLDSAQNQITAARSDIGTRMNRIENSSSNMESMNVNLNKALSDTQNIDIIKVYSELASQQTAYQAALSTSAKISQLSLLNYLK